MMLTGRFRFFDASWLSTITLCPGKSDFEIMGTPKHMIWGGIVSYRISCVNKKCNKNNTLHF